jgi:hypothetical protein
MLFSLDVPYEKIQIFKEALTQFIKARPREWISLLGFRYVTKVEPPSLTMHRSPLGPSPNRSTNIQADLGFIEYIIVLQHRSSWQHFVPIKMSQAEMQSYCLELSKKLDMRYESPPLPVNLKIDYRGETDSSVDNENAAEKLARSRSELEKVAALFDKP